MSKSFGIVEYKLAETEFFLDKLLNYGNSEIGYRELNFYFSAFLTSARSITFTIQKSISDNIELTKNYIREQEKLKSNMEARFFVDARNLSEKVGYYPIRSGYSNINEKGESKMLWYFDPYNEHDLKFVPDEDVLTVSRRFFKTLLVMVQSFYINNGHLIDFEKYYTLENLKLKGMTIEDLEEEIGFPRGWTNIEDSTDEDRITAIRNSQRSETPDSIFFKYLGTNRFGEQIGY